jgi:hypothetical protein
MLGATRWVSTAPVMLLPLMLPFPTNTVLFGRRPSGCLRRGCACVTRGPRDTQKRERPCHIQRGGSFVLACAATMSLVSGRFVPAWPSLPLSCATRSAAPAAAAPAATAGSTSSSCGPAAEAICIADGGGIRDAGAGSCPVSSYFFCTSRTASLRSGSGHTEGHRPARHEVNKYTISRGHQHRIKSIPSKGMQSSTSCLCI